MNRTRIALSLVLLLGSRNATAQTSPSPAAVAEARERFQRGVALSEERNYNAAMVEFQRAYELTRNPAVLFNISATYELTGHYVEALDAMLEYERLAPRETVAQRRAEIDAALARLRGRIGTLVIRFEADGLQLQVDGLQRPVAEARAGLRLAAGRHRVSLSAPHYTPREEVIDLAGGSTVVLSEPLTPERAFMAVDCNVPGAEVLVDGRVVATTPVTSPLPLTEGTHHVMVRRPGFTTYETDVNAVGAGARVRAQLAWADPMPRDVAARIVVQASEPDVVAYLGDRRIDPAGTDLVPPGRHRLRVEHRDFITEEREIDLASAQPNVISVFLQPTPAFREAYFAERRSRIVTGAVVAGVGALVIGAGVAGFMVFNNQFETLDQKVQRLDARLMMRSVTPSRDELDALGCPEQGVNNFNVLETCRENTNNERVTNDVLRWTSVGVASAGLITAIIGVVRIAGAPRGDRFERPSASHDRVRFLGGLQSVGLSISF
jgi:hypothetical protein